MNPFKLIASIYAHPFCYSQHEDVVTAKEKKNITETFIMFLLLLCKEKKTPASIINDLISTQCLKNVHCNHV